MSENYCASVLVHENFHGGQSVNFWDLSPLAYFTGRYYEKIEYPAYRWQLENASRCGLSDDEENYVRDKMDRTKNGEPPE